MKALRINTTVNLATGESVSSGGIVVINDIDIKVNSLSASNIPCVINTSFYKGKNAYDNKKRSISEIEDFSPIFLVNLPQSEYESTGNFELKLINLVKAKLDLIYLNSVEIVNL